MYLEKINDPKDLKELSLYELNELAKEIRNALINKLSKVGGHCGPNLGVVELTIALHYVFSSPKDKIIFDVSHQCYTHKILTGRKKAYLDETHFKDVTGFTNFKESIHDLFTVGHTSTSISLALGVAKERDLSSKKDNVIALIGDGSLSGGEALEGLDTAGEYQNNLIIIVNDNLQSIAENHGGLYKNLKELRETNGESKNNIFKSFGLDYRYLDDGHDLKKLIELFESVKDIDHSIVLHIHTIKGKGLKYAEINKELYHGGGPFRVEDGKRLNQIESDLTLFNSLISFLDNNKDSIVINAATPSGLGFNKEIREKYAIRGQFLDVGIAEENAVAIASGFAKMGGKAIFATFAPFLQRTYDQISHDLCLNESPATILVLSPGVYGMNSSTHIALSDIQEFSYIPNFIYLAPSTRKEYLDMFKFATSQRKFPIGIRVPSFFINYKDDNNSYIYNKNKVLRKGKKVVIFAISQLVKIALEVEEELRINKSINISVVNPLILSSLDEELLNSLSKDHSLFITLEDGEVEGGYGTRIASFFGESSIKVKNLGISKKFHNDFKAEEILKEHNISKEYLLSYILNYLNK